jgi:hypothetical protein
MVYKYRSRIGRSGRRTERCWPPHINTGTYCDCDINSTVRPSTMAARTMVSTRRLVQLLAFIIGAGVSVLGKDAELTQRVLSLCSGQKPIFRSTDKRTLRWLLDAAGEGSLLLQTSPQHLAACWILYTDRKSKGRSKPKLLQRFALATLHYGTTRSNTTSWDWKMAVDVKGAAATKGHWMSVNRHECGWYGVVCDAWSNVIGLEMGWMALDGLIPRELGLLTTLREINFSACDLQGVLPHKMLAALSNLQYLRLHMNGFFGSLHREVAGLRSLKELVAFGNYLGTSRLVRLKGQWRFCSLISLSALVQREAFPRCWETWVIWRFWISTRIS